MNKHMITLLSLLGVGVVFGSETAYGAEPRAEEMNPEVMKVNPEVMKVKEPQIKPAVKGSDLEAKLRTGSSGPRGDGTELERDSIVPAARTIRDDGTEFEIDPIVSTAVANKRRTRDEFTVGVDDVGTTGLHIFQ